MRYGPQRDKNPATDATLLPRGHQAWEILMQRCAPTRHAFRVVGQIVLGLVNTAGWYPLILVRACRQCAYTEVWHGARHTVRERLWIGDIEHWDSTGCVFTRERGTGSSTHRGVHKQKRR